MIAGRIGCPRIKDGEARHRSNNRTRDYDMDWVIVLILTTAPSFSQSHSHYLVNFTSESSVMMPPQTLRLNSAGPQKQK
jgi:hypothetical protein